MNSNFIDSVTIELSNFAEQYSKETILDLFRENESYTVHKRKSEPSYFKDKFETEILYLIYGTDKTPTDKSLNPNGMYRPKYNVFSLKCLVENWQKEVSHLKKIIEDAGLNYTGDIRYSYSRKLAIDEGQVNDFKESIVGEIEKLDYEVSTESTSGTFVDFEEKEKINEYKTWFYIEFSDEKFSFPHHINITFTEDGPFLCGTVLENKIHAEEFKDILTNFSS